VIARAPGKIVLSGAYAVLEGAPSIVTAVDRYVTADTSRPADMVTPEVKAALRDKKAPWFDASALRSGDKKLGLGSSAAILVASLGAVTAAEKNLSDDEALRTAIFDAAIAAHRAAQGGGSGIDVACSVRGGTIIATKAGNGLTIKAVELPKDLHVEVLFAGVSASTSELIGKVRAFKARSPHAYGGVFENLKAAAEDAERAADDESASGLVRALRDQLRALSDLGDHAAIKIVTREVMRLADIAGEEDAVVLPAGAGGGDIAIYVGTAPPSERLVSAFASERHVKLDVRLGAKGLHLVSSASASTSIAAAGLLG
jgi:phosphomevalonate kinase